MKRLTKSKEDYVANKGWSSHYFFEHALYAFNYFERLGYKFDNLSDYTNYPKWIRKEPGKSFCEKVLFANNAIYADNIIPNREQPSLENFRKNSRVKAL